MNNLIEQYKYNSPHGNAFKVFSLKHKVYNTNAYNTNAENNKKIHYVHQELNLSYNAGNLIIGSGLMLLMFSRTAQKNISKGLNKIKNYFEARKEISTVEESARKSKLYGYAIRKLNSFIKKTESINNITSLKDILFMKLMYKTGPTKKIHQTISKLFENLSRNTVVKSYKKTKKSFERMYKNFDMLDEYLLKDSPDEIIKFKVKEYKDGQLIEVKKDFTKRQLVEMAKEYRKDTKLVVDSFISDKSQQDRYNRIKSINSSLYSKFWDESFKDFWTKNNKFKRKEMWQTFIAAEQIKGDKTNLAENVAIARNVISYANTDKIAMIEENVKKLKEIIPAKDEYGTDIVERLDWIIKNSEGLKYNKTTFLKELEKLSNHTIKQVLDNSVTKVQQESKNTCINLIKDFINDESTGSLQDMLLIYYKIAPFELSKFGALLSLKNAVKSFDKSVNLEIGEFFDKVRDLEIGSAPTDILTVLISLGLIIRGLNYAPTDDEKTSVMLKSGIPIVGALITSIVSATKLVSGGKSLALGFISGILLNQAGVLADKLRLKFKRKFNS